jgi:hypothetical protein
MAAIPKTELNKRLRAQRKESGLVKREVWVKPDDFTALKVIFPEWPILIVSDDVLLALRKQGFFVL